MKYFILFLLAQTAFAGPIDSLPCKKEIQSLANEWKSKDEWTKQLQGGLENSFHATPTDKVGEWVLVKAIAKGAVISKIGQDGRIEAVFDSKTCNKHVTTYPHSAPVKGVKNDKDIESFVSKNKQGAIYIWSPRMGLSQKGIKEIKKASANLKLPLLVLLDKDVSDKELKALRKELGNIVTERVDSLEFRMRNVGQHFPAMLVFKDSQILPEVKYGFEKSDRYQSDIVRMLGKGK